MISLIIKRIFILFRKTISMRFTFFKRNSDSQKKAKNEMINIVNSQHTWDHRVNKIIKDINSL